MQMAATKNIFLFFIISCFTLRHQHALTPTSFRVLANNPLVLVRLSLHRLDHLELRAAAHEVVLVICRPEIRVAGKVVSQEAYADRQGDQPRRKGKVVFLRLGQEFRLRQVALTNASK